jgi:hypothetical protein
MQVGSESGAVAFGWDTMEAVWNWHRYLIDLSSFDVARSHALR